MKNSNIGVTFRIEKKLKVKKLDSRAFLPTRKHNNDAGLDLYCFGDGLILAVGDTAEIHYGISVEIPEGYFGLLTLRSSLGMKGVVGHPGIIDSGFRGHISHFIANRGSQEIKISGGDRVGQLLIIPCIFPNVIEVKELTGSERGERGLGSSGK